MPSLAKLAAARLPQAKKAAEKAAKGPDRPAVTLDDFAERYGADPDGFYAFCSLLEIKPKEAEDGGSGRIPFRLTAIQRLYCEARTPRDVILKARQVKITSIELARDAWFFLTKRGVNVRVVCQSSTDHAMLNELSERVSIIFDSLRRNAGLELRFDTDTRNAWTLPNGSSLKIVEAGASEAAAQKKGRGETVHRIHTTELAFWEYAGHTLNAMLEAIAGPDKGTEIVHESTPNGAAGGERGNAKNAPGSAYFYWLCQDARRGASGYAFHFFSWLQCEEYQSALVAGEHVEATTDREQAIANLGAGPEQIKWYRGKVRDKGQDDTDQEYASDPDSCFLVSGRTVFEKSVTERLVAAACAPLVDERVKRNGADGSLRIWHEPVAGASYILAVDTSEGTGGDGAGGQVYEVGTGRHMATLWGQFRPKELAREVDGLGRLFGEALVGVERNNHGHACLQELETLGYPRLFRDRDEKLGWLTTDVSRTAALDALEQAHRSGEWASRDVNVLGEIRTFIINKHGRAEAARGARDDLVMMAAIGWDLLRRMPRPLPVEAQPSLDALDDLPRFSGSRGF